MNIEVIRPASRLNTAGNKITGVYYQDEKLYLGFSNGTLGIYNVDITAEVDQKKAPAIRAIKSITDIRTLFSDNKTSRISHDITFPDVNGDGSPINRIRIVSANVTTNRIIMIISSNDSIRVLEKVGAHLMLVQNVEEAKYFTDYHCFDYKEHKYLACAIKKKVVIFQMQYKTRNIFSYQQVHKTQFRERVKTIACITPHSGSKLLIGAASEFNLMDLENSFAASLLPTNDETLSDFSQSSFSYFVLASSGPSMWTIKITNNTYLLIRDSQLVALTYNDEGCEVHPSKIKFSAVPSMVSLIYPCYLLVVYNKKVEIVDIVSGEIVQKLSHQINSSAIPAYNNAQFTFLAHGNDLLQFNVVDFKSQIDQYLRFVDNDKISAQKDIKLDLALVGLDRAISLVDHMDETDEFFGGGKMLRRKTKQLILRDLYKQKGTVLFENYCRYHESVVEIFSDWLVSYKDVLSLYPAFLDPHYYTGSRDELETIQPTRNVLKKISLQEIDSHKYNTGAAMADSATDIEGDQISKHTKTSLAPAVLNQPRAQNLRKFRKAVNNLIIYLTEQRRVHLNFSNDKHSFQWKGIEITPYDLYAFISPENIESCLSQITVELDTSLFLCYYHCKPMLLGPLLRLPNNRCDSKIVNQCLLRNIHSHNNEPNFIRELLDFYFGRGLHREALDMLYGLKHDSEYHDNDLDDLLQSPLLTMQYLQKLDNSELQLIFEYAAWILKEYPDDIVVNGQLIFMNDTYECESYNNSEVLDYLLNTVKSDTLAIRYLEWLIYDSDKVEEGNKAGDMAKFHTKLCLLYLKALKSLKVSDTVFFQSSVYNKLYKFLDETELYEPWTVLKNIPTSETKFLRFTIFIYRRLQEHDKAIDVLFNQLDDLDGAMKYCSDIYHRPHSEEHGQRLLHKLLEDLLMHYNENIPSIERLLTLQGSKMSMLQILTSLPNTFPVKKLTKFLDQQLRTTDQKLHDTRIASQLYKVGSIKLQHELIMKQSEGYLIESPKKPCAICFKSLGYSVLTVGRDNQIVHYACYQKHKS